MSNTTEKPTLVWSRFTNRCDFCAKVYRLSKADIEEHRPDLNGDYGGYAPDDAVAGALTACHRCCWGDEGIGEYLDERPAARRCDLKGWALAALDRTVLAITTLKNAVDKGRPVDERLTRRLSRCAFVAEGLRDRLLMEGS